MSETHAQSVRVEVSDDDMQFYIKDTDTEQQMKEVNAVHASWVVK